MHRINISTKLYSNCKSGGNVFTKKNNINFTRTRPNIFHKSYITNFGSQFFSKNMWKRYCANEKMSLNRLMDNYHIKKNQYRPWYISDHSNFMYSWMTYFGSMSIIATGIPNMISHEIIILSVVSVPAYAIWGKIIANKKKWWEEEIEKLDNKLNEKLMISDISEIVHYLMRDIPLPQSCVDTMIKRKKEINYYLKKNLEECRYVKIMHPIIYENIMEDSFRESFGTEPRINPSANLKKLLSKINSDPGEIIFFAALVVPLMGFFSAASLFLPLIGIMNGSIFLTIILCIPFFIENSILIPLFLLDQVLSFVAKKLKKTSLGHMIRAKGIIIDNLRKMSVEEVIEIGRYSDDYIFRLDRFFFINKEVKFRRCMKENPELKIFMKYRYPEIYNDIINNN